jgi:hypothetical protein
MRNKAKKAFEVMRLAIPCKEAFDVQVHPQTGAHVLRKVSEKGKIE